MRVCQRLVLLRRRFGVLTVEAQTHRRGVGAGLQPFTLVGSASWGWRPRLVWMRAVGPPPGVVPKGWRPRLVWMRAVGPPPSVVPKGCRPRLVWMRAVGPEVERLWQPVPKAHRVGGRCANGATRRQPVRQRRNLYQPGPTAQESGVHAVKG